VDIIDDIIYLIDPNANPICRDAMTPYAESMGFKIDSLENYKLYDNKCRIIDASWRSTEHCNLIKEVIEYNHKDVLVRLVDDNFRRDEDLIIRDLILKYELATFSPYKIKYFNKFIPHHIPYHYEIADEISMKNFNERKSLAILSGCSWSPTTYPYRITCFEYESEYIENLKHPGYSGKHWDELYVGKSYLEKLSEYKFMIVTSNLQGYELMKYVECAEAGCIPIGEFCKSIKEIIPNSLLKIFEVPNPLDIPDVIKEILDDEYLGLELATEYRNIMKIERSKENIKSELLRIIWQLN